MGRRLPVRCRLALVAILGWSALAAAPTHGETTGEEHLLSVSVGAFDMVRNENDAAAIGLDYRIPSAGIWKLRTWVGLLSTSDDAVWGGGGLYYDWEVNRRLHVTPSFGAGFYEDGVGKDLGHTVEFRSQVDVSFRFRNETRIGFNFGHLSNAGLADSNKGTEFLNLMYTMPVGRKRPGTPLADVAPAPVAPPAD